MSNYSSGRRFEYRVRDHLTADGYDVTRAAGSKGPADLIAIKPGQILFVQVKAGTRGVSPAERAALVRVAGHLPCGVPVIASRDGRGLLFEELTGVGPRDRAPFTTDTIGDN